MASTFNVSSAAQLTNALKAASGGDTILLAPGDYGPFDFNDYDYDSFVTVRSADPGDPAVFDRIDILRSSFLSIDSVHVDSPSPGDVGSKVVHIDEGSHHIRFQNSEVNGKVSASTNYQDHQGHYGVYISGNSRFIRIANNDIHDVRDGLTALGGDNVEVVGNRYSRLGHDTMKFAGVDNILVENNIGPRLVFPTPDAHVDFIQFQGSTDGVTIRGNVYLAGNVANSQGIFLADASYRNVLIEKNIIYTGMQNGVVVEAGSNVTVRDNTILNTPDEIHKSTFIKTPAGSVVVGNIISSTRGSFDGKNLYVQHRDPGGAFHYDDFFANADAGLGLTINDLAPIAGSMALQIGAIDRLMEVLSDVKLSEHLGGVAVAIDDNDGRIVGGDGGDVLIGAGGDDTLAGQDDSDILRGGGGNDRLIGGAGGDTMVGARGSDTLAGRADDDLLRGGAGADDLYGGGGGDRLFGGRGRDLLDGGSGRDFAAGHKGDDRLIGGGARDTLRGGAGDDTLLGGKSGDRLLGGGDDDILKGATGQDVLRGGAGADRLIGGADNDTLIGEAGRDLARGGGGADAINGGGGADRLSGGAGGDRIRGGGGDDTMNGGAGQDRFIFNSGFGDDLIHGFQANVDHLDFSGHAGVGRFADLSIRDVGGDAVIRDGHGGSITLDGVNADDLDAGDFLF